MRSTEKLYYQNQYLTACDARIVMLHGEAIELNRTVAFPEGGGQEADHGTIDTPVGSVRFEQVKRVFGTPQSIEGFKGVKSGGVILHLVQTEDLPLLTKLEPGMPATVRIDALRRAKLTLSHSASHFLYAAALDYEASLEAMTIGCHIKEDSARFDFLYEDRFDADSIGRICRRANELIEQNLSIEQGSLEACSDARFWKYGDLFIPCGGTHLERPQAIGALHVRRKNIGKDKERLICEFPQARLDLLPYQLGKICA